MSGTPLFPHLRGRLGTWGADGSRPHAGGRGGRCRGSRPTQQRATTRSLSSHGRAASSHGLGPEAQPRDVARGPLPPGAAGDSPSCLFRPLVAPGVPGLVAAHSSLCRRRHRPQICVLSPNALCLPLTRPLSFRTIQKNRFCGPGTERHRLRERHYALSFPLFPVKG